MCVEVTHTLLVSVPIPCTCGVLMIAEVFCLGVAMADGGNEEVFGVHGTVCLCVERRGSRFRWTQNTPVMCGY